MESARLRAVTDFSRDVAVDASAGTGKTATLIARVTNLFLADRELAPDRALLLTFTEKAAAEMKARIVEGWERLLAASRSSGSVAEVEERMAAWNTLIRVPGETYPALADLLARAEAMAAGVGRLSVTTFHAFCRRLLLSFPAEAGVDPRFEVLPEGEAADAWGAAFRRFLRGEFGTPEVDPRWETVLGGAGDPEAVWSVIRRLCLSQRDLLTGGGLDLGSPEDFLAYLGREYADPVAWFRAFVGGIAEPGHEMAPVLSAALAVLEEAWAAVGRGDLAAAAAQAGRGSEAFAFRADRTRSRKAFPALPGSTLKDSRDALRRFWRELAEVPPGDAAARFLLDRALAALAFYERSKGSRRDFMDLLLSARGLLAGSPRVAAKLSERFRYVFVDEFQDTDPLQAEMLAAIAPGAVAAAPRGEGDAGAAPAAPSSPAGGEEAAAHPAGSGRGRLFVVGDPKQSIYGFRRADIQVYNRFRRDLVGAGGAAISLVRNFRSRPDLVASVNGLFGAVLSGREDFSPAYAPVVSYREDPGEGPPVTLYAFEEGVEEAPFLCALIERIAGTVRVGGPGAGADRPASFRDIAVLYRSDTGGEVVASYRRAFERAGIPHVVPSRKGFYVRQEIQDLRMVLQAVDAPADPSARHAALKTIFFGLGDEEILPLHDGRPPSPRAADALALLARLSARLGRASLSDLLAELYRETGIEFVAAGLPEGERIARNLAKAAALAQAFEWRGGGSAKAFLGEIRRRTAEDREEAEFPTYDEGEDAVRVSTIHSSKGLEFPIVILANLSRGGRKGAEGLRVDRVRGLSALIFPGFRTYSAFREVRGAGGSLTFERWEREKQRAEEIRLLYVAATRARDRLYLVEGARGQGSDLDDALREGLSRAAPGGERNCLATGLPGTRLLFPPPPESGQAAGPAAPDGSGAREVLRVAVREPLPVTVLPFPPAPDLSFAARWTPPAAAPVAAPPAPVSVRAFFDRERGREFGEKVHRALEAAPPVGPAWPPPGPPPPSVVWGEGEAERWEAIRRAISGSGFFRLLAGTVLVGTEWPLLSCRSGWSREERADLVVRAPAGLPGPRPGPEGPAREYWIVDYKTGRREAALEEAYLRQVRGYMEILASARSVPVRGFVWYVEEGTAVEVTTIREDRR